MCVVCTCTVDVSIYVYNYLFVVPWNMASSITITTKKNVISKDSLKK